MMKRRKSHEPGFEDHRWQPCDSGNAGLRLIMERENAISWQSNRTGPGTYIRFPDGQVRLIGPHEFSQAGREAERRDIDRKSKGTAPRAGS